MEFFTSAIDTLKVLVIALGAGLGVWGVINLLEGYGNDNPGAKSQGMMIFWRKCGPRAMRSKRGNCCPSAPPAGTASPAPISWGPTTLGRPCGSAAATGAGVLLRRERPFPMLAGRSICSLTFRRRWLLARALATNAGRRFSI